MSKKSKISKSISDRRRTLTIIPRVSYKEFYEGFQVAVAAAEGLPLRKNPSEYPDVVMQYADRSARRLGLTDHSLNREFLAVYDYTDRDFRKAWRIHTRLWALRKIVMTERAKRWVIDGGADLQVHFALLDAASFMPLRPDFSFDEKGFFRTVERISAEADADRRADAPPAATGEALGNSPQLEVSCEDPGPADSQVNSGIGAQRAIKRRDRKFRGEIEAVRILARTMLAEKASHREVCSRLGDMPRPPQSTWRHLPWDKAYRDPQYRSAVRRWLSGNCLA
jgi:hypothetical protein